MKTKQFLKEGFTVLVLSSLTAFVYVVYNTVIHL